MRILAQRTEKGPVESAPRLSSLQSYFKNGPLSMRKLLHYAGRASAFLSRAKAARNIAISSCNVLASPSPVPRWRFLVGTGRGEGAKTDSAGGALPARGVKQSIAP